MTKTRICGNCEKAPHLFEDPDKWCRLTKDSRWCAVCDHCYDPSPKEQGGEYSNEGQPIAFGATEDEARDAWNELMDETHGTICEACGGQVGEDWDMDFGDGTGMHAACE